MVGTGTGARAEWVWESRTETRSGNFEYLVLNFELRYDA
jgi:hypothetical protein